MPSILDTPLPARVRDLAGRQFVHLTALTHNFGSRPDGDRYSMWICSCKCGKRVNVAAALLLSNQKQSCGCHRASKTHGKSKSNSRAYAAWREMRRRCMRPRNKSYKHYGGRGIQICERWQSFEHFLSDMGEPPSAKHTLDRYPNNNGHYEPGNCRWATWAEQARNRRSTVLVTLEGRTQCLQDWCAEMRLPYDTVKTRLNQLGWPLHRALTQPVRKS